MQTTSIVKNFTQKMKARTESSLINLVMDTPVLIRSFVDHLFPQTGGTQVYVPSGEFSLMISAAALLNGKQTIITIDETGIHGTFPPGISNVAFVFGVLGDDFDPSAAWKRMASLASIDEDAIKHLQIRCVFDNRTEKPPSDRSLEATQFTMVESLS